MEGRNPAVCVKDSCSHKVNLNCGVPQGSVAGPLMFILYSSPIQDIITSYGIKTVLYADDTQLFITFKSEDRAQAITSIEKCIADVKSWATENKLVLNGAKTKLLHLTSRFVNNNIVPPSVVIGETTITSLPLARNLGITMDSNLCMQDHIDNVCRSALAAIRKIGKIRNFLDDSNTAKLVHAFVTCRLDACNALLHGLPDSYLNKLQHTQNTASRLVARTPRAQHITPVLRSLHWLPIKHRTSYKILLLTFKALHQLAPLYISDMISCYNPT